MGARRQVVLAVLLAVLAAPLGAQTAVLTYTPDQARYRIVQSSHQVQNVAGQRRELDAGLTQLVFVTITPKATDTLRISIRVDSAKPSGSAPTADVPLPGLMVTGLISPTGHALGPYGTIPPTEGAFTAPLDQLRRLLPTLRSDVRVGATWRDSLTSTFASGVGGMITRGATIAYTLVGDTVFDGERAWRVGFSTDVTFRGTLVRFGTEIGVVGQGRTTGTAYISTDGVFLGERTADEQVLNMRVAGTTTVATTTGTVRVDRVKSP